MTKYNLTKHEEARIKLMLFRAIKGFIKNQKAKKYSADLIIKHLLDGLKAGEIIY